MKPYHVIVNPNARLLRQGRFDSDDFGRLLGSETHVTYTRDLAHLEEVVRELRAAGVQTVAILGGDGTIQRICSEFAPGDDGSELPMFYLLGGGTTNALMLELGQPPKPRERLKRLAALLRDEEPATVLERNTLNVNGQLGFIFGAGYLPNASEFYYSHEGYGVWTTLLVTLKVFTGMFFRRPSIVAFLDEIPAAVHYDDEVLRFDAFNMAILSTISENGMNLKITPSAGTARDQFEAVVGKVTVGEFIRTFTKMTFGATMDGPPYERGLLRRVRFVPTEPIPWFMDGELFEPAESITVELGPRIRVLA